MPFRFSLKWLLAATAYVAFAVAAVLQQGEVWGNLLWMVNGVLFLVLVLVALIYRAKPQAVAIGFLLFFGAHVATEKWVPERGPAEVVKVALGVGGPEFHREYARFTYQFRGDPQQYTAAERVQILERQREHQRSVTIAHSIDLMSRVLTGLIGACIAGIVWRRAHIARTARGPGE